MIRKGKRGGEEKKGITWGDVCGQGEEVCLSLYERRGKQPESGSPTYNLTRSGGKHARPTPAPNIKVTCK